VAGFKINFIFLRSFFRKNKYFYYLFVNNIGLKRNVKPNKDKV